MLKRNTYHLTDRDNAYKIIKKYIGERQERRKIATYTGTTNSDR
jgi:hypothetical protein